MYYYFNKVTHDNMKNDNREVRFDEKKRKNYCIRDGDGAIKKNKKKKKATFLSTFIY